VASRAFPALISNCSRQPIGRCPSSRTISRTGCRTVDAKFSGTGCGFSIALALLPIRRRSLWPCRAGRSCVRWRPADHQGAARTWHCTLSKERPARRIRSGALCFPSCWRQSPPKPWCSGHRRCGSSNRFPHSFRCTSIALALCLNVSPAVPTICDGRLDHEHACAANIAGARRRASFA